MEIQVKKLRDVLELLNPVVPRKPTLKSVGYVWLGDGRAVATDLLINVAFELPEAEEELLLPGKDALDFLKYVPGGNTVEITVDGSTVTLSSAFQEASFSDVPSVDEFPPRPVLESGSQGAISGDVFVRTLSTLSSYAAVDNLARPVLSGIYLAPGEEIEAAGADGFRLAWRPIPGHLNGPPMIIPLKGVDVLEHLWKRAAAPDLSNAQSIADIARAPRLIGVNWDSKYLRLNFDSVSLIILLIPGTFPNYHQLIPQETMPSVIVDAEVMVRALAQVAPVAKEDQGIVRLRWEEDVLKVSAKGDGRVITVPISARFTEPGNTALNIAYLKEYFKGLSGLVSFQTESPSTPVLFAYRGVPNTVVMPMFVDQESKAKAKVEEPVDEAAAAEQAEVDTEADAAAEAEAAVEQDPPVKKKRERVKK